jgi:hypothetical protein
VNPYSGLPPHRFWRRSVSNVARHMFDPVVATKFRLGQDDRIATAGSCFAQHISRKLSQIGFRHFVLESGGDLSPEERKRRNFGVFSARYGNIYTTRQLVQIFEEAYGRRAPHERTWQRADGRFVDPYRPNIEPDGFVSAEAVVESRQTHLAYVRQVFEQADVFVFTLGLTETWLSRADNSAFPLAPGVSGGSFDEADHRFVNLNVSDVEGDLIAFLEGLKAVNPGIKVLLTVSPVPLIATYENRSVVVSTTYSKSVLRVAVETVWQKYDWVDYFPSFEIITGSFNGGVYYELDGREIGNGGVAHAMRCFVKNYTLSGAESQKTCPPPPSPPVDDFQIVCDEETIAQVNI